MLEYKLGYFATSLCGHDKGKVYMIVKQEGEMIGLSDGGRRTIDNPKKKNRKHIQIIKHISDEITGLFDGEPTDITIRKAIKIIEKQ